MSQLPPDPGNAKPPKPRNSGNPLQQIWQQTQPVLKTTAARSLRGTIWLLQQALSRVEAAPASPDSIASRSAELASESKPTPTTQTSLLEQLQLVFQQIGRQIKRAWAWLLKTIRSLLPQPQREQLSDTALSGIVVATVLLLLGINSVLRSDKAPPQIAARPAIEQPAAPIPKALPAPAELRPAIEPEPIELPIELPIAGEPEPAIEPPDVVAEPIETPNESDSQTSGSEPESQLEPPASIEVPPALSEPEVVTSSEDKAIEPVPTVEPAPPPLQLTPEQTLVAAIQDQVAGITDQYADGLIVNIQANFRSSQLTVKVEEAWYGLSQSRQNQLAAEMLDRARSLDFARLEVIDPQGTLVARSPLVGSEMIILRRST